MTLTIGTWRVCSYCKRRLKAMPDERCPTCGGELVAERPQKPADPRVRGPEPNREVKPL
jgi:hypothetical protein